MKRILRVSRIMTFLVVALLCAGCEDEEGANEAPAGPDVSGDWSGRYISGAGEVTPISASISQNGTAVYIETTLETEGRLLVGRLSEGGGFLVTDSYSGETWTTGAPVTSSHVQLIDYAFGAGGSLRYIDLTR
ncbi:MAG: hypothetical protein JXB04_13575 [Kiritimatiellae bacterium]|nr:hypothetical protein [Kiritimatiellia bacterium]